MPNPLSDRYTPFKLDDDYVFVTDDGRTYSVSFVEQPFFNRSDFIFSDSTFEVFLRLEKSPPAYFTDPKIGATVTAILQNFIEKDPSRIVFFTCDTADGRQLARFRKFSSWFSENSDGNYFKLEDSVTYLALDKQFLITLIMRNDNQNIVDIVSSFVQLTNVLRLRK
ncbi:DUF6169 family protein [Spirosoma agri]|jgi:hypothetical protein|uniref:Uncharacterized protein n=1 Tax=Spirosoma agri TaxID=1987381 RepID=A0A6M0IL17_9BACT|nr:DUF6169 family protein [Spirosoma agri]NEU67613.1 hypothetical protein [Spirosoma agri]